jgi:hypothetical protein
LEEMMVAKQQQQQQLSPESAPKASSDVSANRTRTITETSNKRLKTSSTCEWEVFILKEAENDLEEASFRSYNTILNECKTELSNYRNKGGLNMFVDEDKRDMPDPLQAWWKIHHMTYPTVWLLAQYYLGNPATSASSERSFSVAGRILNPLAAGSTRSDKFEDMHFLRQNMEEFMDED